jgi:hypothetical protein
MSKSPSFSNGYRSLNEQMYQEKVRVLLGCYYRLTPEEEKFITDLAKRLEILK